MNVRSLWRGRVAGLRAAEEAEKAVAELIDAGWLFLSLDPDKKGKGRKKKDYAVNPKVLKS